MPTAQAVCAGQRCLQSPAGHLCVLHSDWCQLEVEKAAERQLDQFYLL